MIFHLSVVFLHNLFCFEIEQKKTFLACMHYTKIVTVTSNNFYFYI